MRMSQATSIVALLAMAVLSCGALLAGDETTANLDVKLSVKGMTAADAPRTSKRRWRACPA